MAPGSSQGRERPSKHRHLQEVTGRRERRPSQAPSPHRLNSSNIEPTRGNSKELPRSRVLLDTRLIHDSWRKGCRDERTKARGGAFWEGCSSIGSCSLVHFSFRNRQIKIRFGFLNIGEYVMKRKRAGLGGPVMALRDASPQAMHHFTRFRSCPAGTASSFDPVPGVEAMSCRCGGKHSDFFEFFEVPQRARERGHQENLRKPNIEAAIRRR